MRKTWILILMTALLFACRKEQSNPNQPPPKRNSIPITVTVDENSKGSVIPKEFEGLSYETGILAESPEILNANNKQLIQLIKNLGPGLLRIGGDSSDEVFWTGNTRSAASGIDSLTTSDIDRLAAFSRAIGWPVLFGLNMGKNDPATAANEAQYVYNKLGDNLYALQNGNEPDVYHLFALRNPDYSADNYRAEFENYKSTIQSGVPQVSFAGPGIAYNTDWLSSFADNENSNIKLMDAHYYVAGPASDAGITYQTILINSIKLNGLLQVINKESQQYHLPYRITECNSIYGGGKVGVSDVFASALWALDFMWNAASNNAQGVNFHGGNHLVYSPVTIENGVVTARPVYYAMLAFKFAGPGSTNVAASINQPGYNCSVYASINSDNKRVVTLINKDDSNDFYFTVQAKSATSAIQVARLTAPAITSTGNVTFAGSSVTDDGIFTPNITERYSVNGKSYSVNVPAGSAAIITMQ
ncbi:MAG TPA: glycosyl hydrolase family 79 C-terminal domain-containing protein [Mucilaginibacter sp.]|jgi:hypothetical protein